MPLVHEALRERLIGAAIEAHKALGPGFLESIYESAGRRRPNSTAFQ